MGDVIMAEQLQETWLLVVAALLALALVAWWLLIASRRTRVEIERSDDEGAPARRNQALIDARPAATHDAEIPPPTPEGLAGVGVAVAAVAATVPVDLREGDDDLSLVKGLGPKLVEQLRSLGVTRFAQIAAWDDADIDRIDAQLGRFQGRIRRDDWPGQARLLAVGDTTGYEAKFGKL
jgi:predicted flap endonuclease-1-like 5' DNA nuclease